MVNFFRKKIETIETIGEALKRHRKNRGLSIERVARAIQVNPNYLKYIENDEYDRLPAAIYAKNFLRQYSEFLNLNPDSVYERYLAEEKLFRTTRRVPVTKSLKSSNRWINFFLNPKTIKYTLIIIFFVFICGYLIFSINKIFSKPELIVSFPTENNLITTDRSIELTGVTEREVLLTVNARQVLYDKNGRFAIQIDLQKGLNIIKIEAAKKHSRPNTIYKQIIVE